VSAEHYTIADMADKNLDAEPIPNAPAFKEQEKLASVAGSLRYHRIRAIETKADEYDNVYDLFVSDLNRRLLGLGPKG